MRDNIFKNKNDIVNFSFDEKVVAVFDDMVKRSVPGYEVMIQMIGLITRNYGQDNSNYYDIGASTGAATMAMALNNKNKGVKFIAIDKSIKMVTQCSKNIIDKIDNIEVKCGDIDDICIKNAGIVILNLTLQFIDIKKRDSIIKKIYEGLKPNGILIISEKVHTEDTKEQNLITQMHTDFKRANGYNEIEIAKKRQSLENVLLTESSQQHLNRLNKCGFSKTIKYFKCINFVSFLSVK